MTRSEECVAPDVFVRGAPSARSWRGAFERWLVAKNAGFKKVPESL